MRANTKSQSQTKSAGGDAGIAAAVTQGFATVAAAFAAAIDSL